MNFYEDKDGRLNDEKGELSEPDIAESEEREDEECVEGACETRLKEAESALAALQDRLLRTTAEMENVRRRAQKDKEDAVNYGNASLAKDILGFIDNLDRALQPSTQLSTLTPEHKALVDGLVLMKRDILAAFERHGIQQILSDGQPFDPTRHQAVSEVVEEGVQPGCVAQTLLPGYTIHGRLLRAAMVVVAK